MRSLISFGIPLTNLLTFLTFFPSTYQLKAASKNTTSAEKMKDILMKFKVIPDVIKTVPRYKLEVRYLANLTLNFGDYLDAHKLVYAPYSVKWPSSLDNYYTMIMTDPDMPSARRPTLREFVHWIVGNMQAIFIISGEELVEYMPPNPHENSGIHRCVFLVYQQPHGLINYSEARIEDRSDVAKRFSFSSQDFAKKYDLGEPIGVNFFTTQWKAFPATRSPWIQDDWGDIN